ncbi:hypothetical protein COCSUDRAFT_45907 [Coccomyxa subellipsoidea C-169]|uniref:GAF domain-containing protein n=1 Tax=Coccomyxa subellipsoidea (strain C-169) TaxID=574566 RepID=I0ZA75_COCSC|nr:hypothetical protein COCSUDRAFT_45907 [Coccomyxa subellipsoidea C-169]EIE27544.1 hypothetical protein COCSUDRAFT_45907 [Coccomyxa subellipsoidea C-169]|eukprot:XP_005652088.1 hypothetical protein COCSUDRAFT_45907 [Coccomyxa subellipsoidea C-169]
MVHSGAQLNFSLLSENEAQLHYFEVHSAKGRRHGHLGTFPVQNTGSGVAVTLKQPVLTSKNGRSGLRRLDWQHLQHMCGAGSCIYLPLKVSDKVLGTLNIASVQPDAFSGLVDELVAFAAVLAPVIGLQRLRRDLVAVDDLLRRILPAHIADSLHELRQPLVSPGMPREVTQALVARATDRNGGSAPAAAPAATRIAAPPATAHAKSRAGPSTLPPQRSTCQPAAVSVARSDRPAASQSCRPCWDGSMEGESICCKASAGKEARVAAAAHCVLDAPVVPRLFMDFATLLLTLTPLLVLMSRSWTFEQAIPVATLVAVALAAMQMGGVLTYAKHRNSLLAGLRLVRTLVFAVNMAWPVPSEPLSCAGLCMDSGAFLLAILSFSGQVPARVHLPLQATCITVLAAADAVGCALGRTSVQLALAKVVAQTVLGGVLPSLVLLHMEQAAALARHRSIARKKVD